MFSLEQLALISVIGSSLVAGSAITYYYGYELPKRDKAVLAIQQTKLSVTPTPTLTLTPTPTATPTATLIPTRIIRYIPSLTPTPTSMKVLDVIEANNKCIGQCFRSQAIKDNASCATNYSQSCATSLSQAEMKNCVDTCKDEYNK